MDECARETVLEALQQNKIKPFSDARSELMIAEVSIPPPVKKAKKGSKKRKSKLDPEAEEAPEYNEEKWQTFNNMKEAIDAGWKVRNSFLASKLRSCRPK